MKVDHPAFFPYRALIDTLALPRALPTLDALNALACVRGTRNTRGLQVQFVEPSGRLSARAYETHILQTGCVPTRTDNWHDVLNALVWLRFPRFKAALNAAHGAAIESEATAARGPRRDALTLLDESGVWVASRSADLSRLLIERAWQPLFRDARVRVETEMRFVVVGHALLEKALAPYPSMTGKCLMLTSGRLDPEAAETEAAALVAIATPRELAPLPVQGIPGWDPANADGAYYANPAVFRPARPAPG